MWHVRTYIQTGKKLNAPKDKSGGIKMQKKKIILTTKFPVDVLRSLPTYRSPVLSMM
jgi:hypothetical protein